MGPEYEIEKSLRSEYAFLFRALAKLYELRCGEETPAKYEDVKKAVSKMEEGGFLDEYLKENLNILLGFYPELHPAKVASRYRKNPDETEKKLENIMQLVRTIAGDVCGEISDLMDEARKSESESFIKRIVG